MRSCFKVCECPLARTSTHCGISEGALIWRSGSERELVGDAPLEFGSDGAADHVACGLVLVLLEGGDRDPEPLAVGERDPDSTAPGEVPPLEAAVLLGGHDLVDEAAVIVGVDLQRVAHQTGAGSGLARTVGDAHGPIRAVAPGHVDQLVRVVPELLDFLLRQIGVGDGDADADDLLVPAVDLGQETGVLQRIDGGTTAVADAAQADVHDPVGLGVDVANAVVLAELAHVQVLHGAGGNHVSLSRCYMRETDSRATGAYFNICNANCKYV